MDLSTHTCLLIITICLMYGCADRSGPELKDVEDPILAETYGRELRFSEFRGVFGSNISVNDSLQLLRSLTETWVRDQLIKREAEKNVKDKTEIDRLVKEYEEALVMYEYERLLVENLLDSTITPDQLASKYDEEQQQFPLDESVYRFELMSISSEAEDYYQMRNWWNDRKEDGNIDSLAKYCNAPDCELVLSQGKWVKEDLISNYFPERINWQNRLDDQNEYTYWGEERRVLLHILEERKKGEFAPMEFIKDQLKVLILHDRTRDLFESVRNDLYEKAVENNALKIYTQ